jgi:hypothetical protein
MKKQLAVLLAEIGFLHRRHNADVMSPSDPVNQFATNIRLVEAVIVAGLYPHVARLETAAPPAAAGGGRSGGGRDDRGPSRPRWVTRDGDVSIHPSSVLFHEHDGFDSVYLCFHEKVKTTKVYVRDATVVGAYALLLFGVDMDCQHDKSLVILDDWLSFKIKPRTAALLSDLRVELRKILVEKIQCPSADLGFAPPRQGGEQHAAALLADNAEGSEARAEFRRVLAPASMLLPAAQAASDPTSGLASSVAPGVVALRGAPDLIAVVALLLAEEDKNRRKAREAAAATHAAPAGVIATVKAAQQQTNTAAPASTPTPTGPTEPAHAASTDPATQPPQPQSQPRQQKPRSQQPPKQKDLAGGSASNRDRPRSARPPKQQSNNNDRARAPAASSAAPASSQQWEESI